jgi:hypothetical protein
MTTSTIQRSKIMAAGAALFAASFGLSGCINFSTDFDGEPLADLDQSGSAPTEIALAGPDDIVLVEGDTLNIEVSGDSDAIEALRFKRKGDTLAVGRDGEWGNSKGTATITITMPAPKEISLAGSGDITAEALASDAEISMAGSGKVTVAQVSSDELEISSAGSGRVQGAGSVDKLSITIVGSGDVDFAELKADDVEISIAGSGDIDLMSDGKVEASIAGSGSVKVTGSATCKSSAMGSGELICQPA